MKTPDKEYMRWLHFCGGNDGYRLRLDRVSGVADRQRVPSTQFCAVGVAGYAITEGDQLRVQDYIAMDSGAR